MNLIKRGSVFWFDRVTAIQSVFYIITGLWAHVHIRSFIWVTGPKTDIWLVKTVGILIVVIGIVLLISRFRKHYSVEIIVLAIGTAVSLAVIEIYYVLVKRISPVYLLDAIFEFILIGIWVRGLIDTYLSNPPRKKVDPE
jgi:hypothetical protein